MLRWCINTAIRGIKRGIPSLKRGVFERTRQASNVSRGIESFTVTQQQLNGANLFRKSFFSHWLQMISRNTRLRCHPVLRTASQRNSTSLFLAFVGFAYIGNNNNLSCENFTKSDQNLHSWLQDALKKTTEKIPEKSGTGQELGKKLSDYEVCERLGKPSCNSAVYAAKRKSNGNEFAIKMCFNLYAPSQSHSLKRAFSKEITVLSGVSDHGVEETSGYIALPEHHNIMNILSHFADNIPELLDAAVSYPAALPRCLHENGYGRNRTMFLVMPRFAGTLSDYVHQSNISKKTSLALFTQLLEGLAHLNKNNVAHRDLKNDNLLVSESTTGFPHLVITDFDCCLAEKNVGLVMPYETNETSKGGNALLMPPEVACAKSGQGQTIDYRKADEWAAGALAYEMFGQQNPFEQHCLDKETYKISDVPELGNAPKAIQKLVKQLLQRHPNDRPSVSLAATVSQLVLWAPGLFEVPKSFDLIENIKRWFSSKTFNLAVKMSQYKAKHSIPFEQRVLYTFLSRTTAEEILDAIEWLNSLKE